MRWATVKPCQAWQVWSWSNNGQSHPVWFSNNFRDTNRHPEEFIQERYRKTSTTSTVLWKLTCYYCEGGALGQGLHQAGQGEVQGQAERHRHGQVATRIQTPEMMCGGVTITINEVHHLLGHQWTNLLCGTNGTAIRQPATRCFQLTRQVPLPGNNWWCFVKGPHNQVKNNGKWCACECTAMTILVHQWAAWWNGSLTHYLLNPNLYHVIGYTTGMGGETLRPVGKWFVHL